MQDFVLWRRGPEEVGLNVALCNTDLRKNTALFWEAKGANKVLEKKPHGQMLFPRVPEGRCYQPRCDSTPVLQDYKQNLKQLI